MRGNERNKPVLKLFIVMKIQRTWKFSLTRFQQNRWWFLDDLGDVEIDDYLKSKSIWISSVWLPEIVLKLQQANKQSTKRKNNNKQSNKNYNKQTNNNYNKQTNNLQKKQQIIVVEVRNWLRRWECQVAAKVAQEATHERLLEVIFLPNDLQMTAIQESRHISIWLFWLWYFFFHACHGLSFFRLCHFNQDELRDRAKAPRFQAQLPKVAGSTDAGPKPTFQTFDVDQIDQILIKCEGDSPFSLVTEQAAEEQKREIGASRAKKPRLIAAYRDSDGSDASDWGGMLACKISGQARQSQSDMYM